MAHEDVTPRGDWLPPLTLIARWASVIWLAAACVLALIDSSAAVFWSTYALGAVSVVTYGFCYCVFRSRSRKQHSEGRSEQAATPAAGI